MSTVGRKSNRERIHQEMETEKNTLESILGWNPVSWLASNLAHAMPSSIHRVWHNKLMKQQDI